MPSKDDYRRHISFGKRVDVLVMVERDAELEERSISSIVVRALASYYAQRKQEAELFKSQSPAGQNGEAPVFETPNPAQIEAARASALREQHGQEKS